MAKFNYCSIAGSLCDSTAFLLHLLYLLLYVVCCLTDDQNVVDSVPTANANGTWKQGRHLLRQSVYHSTYYVYIINLTF